MELIIYAAIILLLIMICLLCRWGKLVNESLPNELNAADRYATTSELEKQIKNS